MGEITFGEYGTLDTVLTTELNSLANGSAALSGALDNSSAGPNGALALFDRLELVVAFGGTMVAGKTVDVYRVESLDGTNYADGVAGATPAQNPAHYVGSFALRGVTGAHSQRVITTVSLVPSATWKYQVVNASGVAFTASGHTLKRRPFSLLSA